MKAFAIIFLLIFITACDRYSDIKQADFMDKTISLDIHDTIIFKGDYTENIFTYHLYPVRYNSSEFIAYDLITRKLLFFNKEKHQKEYQIDKIVDLQTTYSMYSSIKRRLIGVVEVSNNRFIICSEPYFLILDEHLGINEVFNFDFKDSLTSYYITADIRNLKTNSDKTHLYLTVAPGLPTSHENYFTSGRIVEIDIKEGNYRILPVTLPYDYAADKNYRLFDIPNFTIFDDNLFYIYPGSNYLYEYNPKTDNLDSTIILPQHVEINSKEVGRTREDIIYTQFECNNFYQILNDDELMLMFYWEGKKRKTYNRQDGVFKALDCYILGYKPDENIILFDKIFEPSVNHFKMAYVFKDGKLYLHYDPAYDPVTESDKIESKLFVYELIIK